MDLKAFGIVTTYISGQSGGNFFLGLASDMALGYSGSSIGLNVVCTALITGRILWVAKKMDRILGSSVSRTYTSAASIVIESMMPYTIFGVAYLITLGLNHPTSDAWLSVYVMMTVRCNVSTEPCTY